MAQASSAQREPSMEEILASIRRIIEDSDTARQPLEAEGGPHFSLSPERDDIQQEVEAFRAGLDEGSAPQPEDLIRPVRDEPVSVMPPQRPEEHGPAMEPEAVMPPVQVRPSVFVNAAPSHSRAQEPLAAQDEKPDMPDAQSAEAKPGTQEPMPVSSDGPAEAGIMDSGTEEARAALISDHAGRQVAAAFGELSEAFAASRRRSFDEMAEEMLRPMLQDWLDNNLPTLVERLVREEIERVARGG